MRKPVQCFVVILKTGKVFFKKVLTFWDLDKPGSGVETPGDKECLGDILGKIYFIVIENIYTL
jgi:hypothetical protein